MVVNEDETRLDRNKSYILGVLVTT